MDLTLYLSSYVLGIKDEYTKGGSLSLCGNRICRSPWKHGCSFHDSSLLISEHGIYTREREEELIKAEWVKGAYKNIWIEQFKRCLCLPMKRQILLPACMLVLDCFRWSFLVEAVHLGIHSSTFSLLFRIRLRRGRDIRALKGIPRRANKAKVGS